MQNYIWNNVALKLRLHEFAKIVGTDQKPGSRNWTSNTRNQKDEGCKACRRRRSRRHTTIHPILSDLRLTKNPLRNAIDSIMHALHAMQCNRSHLDPVARPERLSRSERIDRLQGGSLPDPSIRFCGDVPQEISVLYMEEEPATKGAT
jgi:hypothetical protein